MPRAAPHTSRDRPSPTGRPRREIALELAKSPWLRLHNRFRHRRRAAMNPALGGTPVLRRPLVPLVLSVAAALVPVAPGTAMAHRNDRGDRHRDSGVKHIVVVYQENHSFDNLFGGWEGVNGLAQADVAHTKQVSQSGAPYSCLLQDDVNLTSPPLDATCSDSTTPTAFTSNFANEPFAIDAF